MAWMIQGRVLFKDTRKESVESLPKKTSSYREMPNWTSDECQALVSFLLLYTDGLSWSLQQCLCSNKQSPFTVVQILSLHAYFGSTSHY